MSRAFSGFQDDALTPEEEARLEKQEQMRTRAHCVSQVIDVLEKQAAHDELAEYIVIQAEMLRSYIEEGAH